MQGVFSWSVRTAAAWLLIVVLLAPTTLASETIKESGLWAEFVAWIETQVDGPDGVTVADDDSFVAWLLGRITVPGG